MLHYHSPYQATNDGKPGQAIHGRIILFYKKNPSFPAQNYLPEYKKSLKGIFKYTLAASTALKSLHSYKNSLTKCEYLLFYNNVCTILSPTKEGKRGQFFFFFFCRFLGQKIIKNLIYFKPQSK